MPRISTYDLDNTLENTDKFLGSNSDGTVKNFKLSDSLTLKTIMDFKGLIKLLSLFLFLSL